MRLLDGKLWIARATGPKVTLAGAAASLYLTVLDTSPEYRTPLDPSAAVFPAASNGWITAIPYLERSRRQTERRWQSRSQVPLIAGSLRNQALYARSSAMLAVKDSQDLRQEPVRYRAARHLVDRPGEQQIQLRTVKQPGAGGTRVADNLRNRVERRKYAG